MKEGFRQLPFDVGREIIFKRLDPIGKTYQRP